MQRPTCLCTAIAVMLPALATAAAADPYTGTCRFLDDPTRKVIFSGDKAINRVDGEKSKYYFGLTCNQAGDSGGEPLPASTAPAR